MVPINKGLEPFLMTMVHDKGQGQRDPDGDLVQQVSTSAHGETERAARMGQGEEGWGFGGQELPRIRSM